MHVVASKYFVYDTILLPIADNRLGVNITSEFITMFEYSYDLLYINDSGMIIVIAEERFEYGK